MNKKIRLIIVSLTVLTILGINISYAISNSNMSVFFEVNKTEIAKGETLEMTIDLSKIDYKKFEFVLNSNVKIASIYTDEKVTDKDDIILNKEDNDIVIDINKEQLNLSKIVLYYQIPESIEIGTKIELNAQIKIENSETENQEKNDIENQAEDNKEENWTIIDTKQVEITIIEKNTDNTEDKNEKDNKNEENKKQEDNKQNENTSKNNSQNENMQEKTINDTSSVKNTGNNVESTKGSNAQTDTVTYNGSNNNYLTSLTIEDAQLTTDFNKEKSIYFATVENMEEITVTANVEDSSSKVAITGTNLKNGENKVLISVTAENGDVRYYRIYVTKK